MGPLSKYWEILRIDPGDQGCGYKPQSLPLASEFFQAEFAELAAMPPEEPVRGRSHMSVMTRANVRSHIATQHHRRIQTVLHNQFSGHSSDLDLQHQANAGLCLRGYVSYSIVIACKLLANKFSAIGQLTYRDLLPYVLNDDGERQVILDPTKKQQLRLHHGQIEPSAYQLFSVEVLRQFDPNADNGTSLDNWVHLKTRQNQELKKILSERGFYKLSDWALLNRAGPHQLDKLSQREHHIINAFHRVYRRDRRQQRQNHQTCPVPTLAQLHEMQQYLQTQGISFTLPEQLTVELKQISQTLRQYAIWSSNGMPPAESLEAADPYSGHQREFCDPNSTNNLEQIVQQELREFCQQQLLECLDWAINQGICEHIHGLSQRPRYAIFSSKVKAILKLVYEQGQSQRKIADTLGMTNQSQVSRVLNPTTLLKRIRYWTVEHFFQILAAKVSSLNLTTPLADPDYLENLIMHIEAFVDAEAFQAAVAEIKTAKNRPLDSLYAQRLRHYLER